MSSGFVSGGTVDAPTERSDEWLAAQKDIEANRQRKLDEQAARNTGRSLFETLEANKIAKQEAFEEANKLKNQFRPLDDDEIDFLDSVLESTRREEARVQKETAEGLALFRQQQEKADKQARSGTGAVETEDVAEPEENWVAGPKKRKRTKEKEGIKGLKVRRLSTAEEKGKSEGSPASIERTADVKDEQSTEVAASSTSEVKDPPVKPKDIQKSGKSSLVAYGSDSDEE